MRALTLSVKYPQQTAQVGDQTAPLTELTRIVV